jgi:hypothetical protein
MIDVIETDLMTSSDEVFLVAASLNGCMQATAPKM